MVGKRGGKLCGNGASNEISPLVFTYRKRKNNKELPLKFKYDSTHVVEPGICMFLIIPTSTVKLKAGMARVDYAAVHEC